MLTDFRGKNYKYSEPQALECGQSQLVDNAATMAVDGSVALLAYVPLDATFADAAEVNKH